MQLLHKLAESINPADIRDALKAVAKQGKLQVRYGLTQRLLSRWGRLDAKAALAYAEGLAVSRTRSSAFGAVLEGWVQQDAERATAWVNQLPAGPERNQLLQAAVGSLAAQAPDHALDLLTSSAPSPMTRALEGSLFRQWAERDPAGAAAAAAASSVRDARLLGSIASSWGRTRP